MTARRDPFTVPLVLLRVGWMNRYQGITRGDTISHGGAFVAKHGFGHEIFNFRPFGNSVYGYAQPTAHRDEWFSSKINLTRLGASKDDASVDGVLVIWVATSPQGGGFVVGWYKNATVYRDWQKPPSGSGRKYAGQVFGYYVSTKVDDALLLPPDERVFRVPQMVTGGFGNSNFWYADDRTKHLQLRMALLRYVETRCVSKPPKTEGSLAHQPDPLLRQKVEQAAVKVTRAYFRRLNYSITSVEQDNVGWDLNAILDKRELKLEVKGLSGNQIVVELTPNEYMAMKTYCDSYRICVVTNALTYPRLEVFAYSNDSRRWESTEGRVLNLQEIIAVHCTAM
jgi:hypothetical protein